MKKNYLVSIIGIGLVSGSMAVSAETWRYNSDSDLIDYSGDFKTVPASKHEIVQLGNESWVYDESLDSIVYRFDDTRTIPAAAHIGSQGIDEAQLQTEADAYLLEQ